MREFDQRRRGSAPVLGCTLESPVFILEAQGANAADVIDGEQIIQRIERAWLDRLADAITREITRRDAALVEAG